MSEPDPVIEYYSKLELSLRKEINRIQTEVDGLRAALAGSNTLEDLREHGWSGICAHQREEIDRFRSDLAEAREALKPLADYARYFENMPDDYNGHFILTAGQCRRAERAQLYGPRLAAE